MSVPPTACHPLHAQHVHFNLIFKEKTEHHDSPQAPLPEGISSQSQKAVTNSASEFSTCSTLRLDFLSLHTHCSPLEHKAFHVDARGSTKLLCHLCSSQIEKTTLTPKRLSTYFLGESLCEFSSEQLLVSLGKTGQLSFPEAITAGNDGSSHLARHQTITLIMMTSQPQM